MPNIWIVSRHIRPEHSAVRLVDGYRGEVVFFTSRTSAEAHACREAASRPDRQFYVLEATDLFRTEPVPALVTVVNKKL